MLLRTTGQISVIGLQANTAYNIRCYDTEIRLIHGSVNINGYQMLDKHYKICSLNTHAAIPVHVGSSSHNTASYLKSLNIEHDDSEELGAILEVRKTEHNNMNMLRNTYKNLWDIGDIADVSLDNFVCSKGMGDSVVITDQWKQTVSALLTSNNVRLAVCGPQNSGKSTLCRYTVNRLLSVHQKLLFLETDIGQCEFTPSGLITLSLLSQPLLSPPYDNKPIFTKFLNLKQEHLASESFCFGVVSPSQILNEYLEKVKILIDKAKRLNEEIPLVVNFMGWTKGFGVALHADLLRMLDPSHVINLCTNKRKDLPPITELLTTPGIAPLDPSSTQHIPSPLVCDVDGFTGVKTAGSKTEGSKTEGTKTEGSKTECSKPSEDINPTGGNKTPSFQAYELRHMALLNYFSPIYDTKSAITIPYKVSWKHIAVILPEDAVPELAAYTLNCSVVGLLVGTPVYNSCDTIKVTTDDTTRQCVGYGIVRCVDVKEKLFYLNTPVPADILEQVVVFKHTSLPIPHLKSGSLPVPYVSNLAASEIIGLGSRSHRGNLKRRYHAISTQA